MAQYRGLKKWFNNLPNRTSRIVVLLFGMGLLVVVADCVLMTAFALQASGITLPTATHTVE